MDVHGRDLRYFVAVAEELHFTRAAERLFISQPALSKQVRMLEWTLGVALFERDGRSVSLTPAGTALLPHARNVLAAWDEGWASVEQSKRTQASTLVVGMSTSPGRDGLLPAIRSRFSQAVPHARLALRLVGWEDPTAGLADQSSDIAFVWLPIPAQNRYEWTVIAAEPCLVAMAQNHRFAGRVELDFADFVGRAVPRAARQRRAATRFLARDRRARRTAARDRRDHHQS